MAEDEQDLFNTRPSCTDPMCLIIFLVYLGGMAWIAQYSFQHGDPRRLAAGIDFAGNMCGIDTSVENASYIYWCPDPTKPVVDGVPEGLSMAMPICVESCPTNTGMSTWCPQPTEVTVPEQNDNRIVTRFETRSKQLNAYQTTPFGKMYCLPDFKAMDSQHIEMLRSQLSKGDPFSNPYVKLDESIGGLVEAKYLLAGIITFALVLSWLYVWLLGKLAKEIMYASIVIVVLGCGSAGSLFIMSAYDVIGLQKHNPLYEELSDSEATLYSQIIGGALAILALVSLIVFVCLRETLERVVGCIEAAGEALTEMPTLWLEPIVAGVMKLVTIAVLLTGLVYLMSLGEVEHSMINLGGAKVSGFGRSLTYTQDEWYMLFYYVLGVFWIIEFSNAVQTFVVSYATVKWFAMPMPKNGIVWFPIVRGFLRCIIFHLGSMACGSFLIAVTRIVSLVMWFIAKHADEKGTCVGACLAKCCLACIECFRRCLECLNKNAYVDIAIDSRDFFHAAKNSFNFMKSNAVDIMILNGACWLGQFSGILFVSGSGGSLTYLAVTNVDRWSRPDSQFHIADPVIVSVMAGLICFSISAMFMALFDDIADAMLYCYAHAREQGVAHVYAPDTLQALADKHEISANPAKGDQPLLKA